MGCGNSKQTETADKNDPKKEVSKQPSKQPKQPKPAEVQEMPKGKYVVNGSANGSMSESNDKGFKRRIRENLKKATTGTDIMALDKAMEKFKHYNLEDCGDWTRAVDRMEYLKLKKDLRDSIMRSHVGTLEKTIATAEKSKFAGQLTSQIEAAKRELQHLKELNTYSHDIMNMEQNTISEIHSYQRPPACVHDVMAATYMLLGHKEQKLTDWGDIQALMCNVSRDSLIHQVRDFDSARVDEQTTNRVQDILRPHELHNIRQASNGAAAFYVWSTQICEKVERDKAEEEERLRREEEERQKEEERQSAKGGKGKNQRKPKG